MDSVFDKNKNIVKIKIYKEYYNNYSSFKQDYINTLPTIEDELILKILTSNYLLYGLVSQNIIENYQLNNRLLYTNEEIIKTSTLIKTPNDIFNEVNSLINDTNTFLNIVNNNYKTIMDYDINIMNYLMTLKKTNLKLYLDNLVLYNNIRNFIHLVFCEYYQDVNYINDKLLQLKYDYFILEPNINQLNIAYSNSIKYYDSNKIFRLNIIPSVKFEIIKGNIDINGIINIVEEKTNKLKNLIS
jgi:hypothetical protein